MNGVHYVLHAPQGDTYADLLFTMIERNQKRPRSPTRPSRRAIWVATRRSCSRPRRATRFERFRPQAMLVGASCTAELIQDDPGGLARALDTRSRSSRSAAGVPAQGELGSGSSLLSARAHFRRAERAVAGHGTGAPSIRDAAALQSARTLGARLPSPEMTCRRSPLLLGRLGVDVHVVAPLGATPADLARLGDADFNIVLYPEIGAQAAKWLERTFQQPVVKTVPIGVGATRDFIAEVAGIAGIDPSAVLANESSRLPWYSRSVNSTYLTGKRAFVFGDATHAIAAARIASKELGFRVVGLGTYSREFAREVREAAKSYDVEPLITDDYLQVETKVSELQPDLVLGTQMERHIAKRLGIPCAVISAPVHVQDFPARYSPQMGFEGANVIFDAFVHPLMMGLEEHLLGMFREDREFHGNAAPSHLAPAASSETTASAALPSVPIVLPAELVEWAPEAEKELQKIPFFVRGKARRNAERFAQERSVALITIETLYDAKAHFGR